MLLHSIISSAAVLGLLCTTSLAAPASGGSHIRQISDPIIGNVYAGAKFGGAWHHLKEGCNVLGPKLAGQVSSFKINDHWACNFYRSDNCREGFMFEAGNRSDATLKGNDNDAARSVWCNPF